MLNRVNHRAAGRGGSKTKARNRGLQQTPCDQFKAKYQCKRPPGKARGRTAAATAAGRRRNLAGRAAVLGGAKRCRRDGTLPSRVAVGNEGSPKIMGSGTPFGCDDNLCNQR